MSATRSKTADSLRDVLDKAVRVQARARELRVMTLRGEIIHPEETVVVTDPQAIRELRDALLVSGISKGVCGCIEIVTLIFFDARGRLLARVPWHRSHIVWRGLRNLRDGAAVARWLAAHGLDPAAHGIHPIRTD